MAQTAKKPASAKAESTGGYIVISQFRDRDDYGKEYEIGDDLSDMPQDRLDTFVSLGLVTAPPKAEVKAELTAEEKEAQKKDKAAQKAAEDQALKDQKAADEAAKNNPPA